MKAKIGRGDSFRGLLNYVFGPGEHGKSDRAQIVAGNMSGADPDSLAKEFGTVRRLRPNIKNPVWHCSLSLPAGEWLAQDRWNGVCVQHLKNMGLDPDNHLWIAVRHDDNGFDHVHLVVSRIGLNEKLWHGRNDVKAAIESTQALEHQFGLTLTPGLDADPSPGSTYRERAGRSAEPSIKGRMKRILDRALRAKDFESFIEICLAAGMKIRPNIATTGRVNGLAFTLDGETMKAADLGGRYKWAKISATLGFDPTKHLELLRAMVQIKEHSNDQLVLTPAAAGSIPTRSRRNRTLDLLFSNEPNGDFLWKKTGTLAFTDFGDRIRLQNGSNTSLKAALQLAIEKGWKSVNATGSPDFCRRLWLQAELLQIEVQGYAPDADDILMLQQLRLQRQERFGHGRVPEAHSPRPTL